MVSLVEPGFAIRRMSQCLSGLEVDCGRTGNDGFHACCPSALVCPGPQYNVVCCPAGASDCTESSLAAKPQPPCANATWDMFDNGGYFCCEHGLPGYNKSNSNGCAAPNLSISGIIQPLRTVRVGVDPATIASSRPSSSLPVSSASASSAPSSSSTSTSKSTSSSTPVGAIAGGVVGGVAALAIVIFLIWFCLRRRRRQNTPELHGGPHTLHEGPGQTKYRAEANASAVYEVGEHESRMPVAEMAAHQKPVELDGMGRTR